MKNNKKEIYAEYGIEYENGKIFAPLFGWINPLLVDGNAKLGKGVWTFSTLPGTMIYDVVINGKSYAVKGTCVCNCKGCYAMTGFYNMPGVKAANAMKTMIARSFVDFMRRAITAQIKADNIKLCRLHASGDFFSAEYISAWQEIVKACPECLFWTYTKSADAVNAFDDFDNANIVKSIIPGRGFNFGHCDYILRVYRELKAAGNSVYICKCGIDKNQHCTNCKGCATHDFVLFIEHSTAYKAENDAAFPELKAIIESQSENA